MGFKTKLRSLVDPDGFRSILSERKVRVIRLYRRNMLKQIVSAERARLLQEKTGKYNITKDMMPEAIGKISISKPHFQHWLHVFNAQETAIDDYILKLGAAGDDTGVRGSAA